MTSNKTFEHYRKRISYESGINRNDGVIRYNVIEYLCSFPGIDPAVMGAALVKDGYKIAFDDSSIPKADNAKKRREVLNHFTNSGTNSICFDCKRLGHDCNGASVEPWTGCVYREI